MSYVVDLAFRSIWTQAAGFCSPYPSAMRRATSSAVRRGVATSPNVRTRGASLRTC